MGMAVLEQIALSLLKNRFACLASGGVFALVPLLLICGTVQAMLKPPYQII